MIKLFYSIFMLLVCTTTGCISDEDPKGPSLSVGDPLPQFFVVMNDGSEFSTQSLSGKVPVIVFFNTECSDCRKELPVIQQLWETYRDEFNVVIIPIAREESFQDISSYWEENDLSMPFSPQDSRDIYNLFAPSVIPRIYIANKSGVITECFDDSDMPSLPLLINSVSNNL